VTDVTQLRPGTTIKDDGIAALLHAASKAVFVTINVKDFWRRTTPHERYCVVCCDVPTARIDEIAGWLGRLFAHELFRTQKQRLGKVLRVTPEHVQFYSTDSWTIQDVE